MALALPGLGRLATEAGAALASALKPLLGSAVASTWAVAGGVVDAGAYVARTVGCPAGVRGVAVEWAWLAAHLAVYPAGLLREQLTDPGGYRTDTLPLAQRSLVVTDVAAAGTPILLVHGIMDNRSVFTVFRRTLRRRGFGSVHAVNYSLFTGDVRAAAHQLGRHVERLREQTGADSVHIVGHSLGGIIARYYVQRMGGSAVVDTLATLGSPHSGTLVAYLLPTALARQLRPGSDLMAELARPAPGCATRMLVVWSRMDEMIIPQKAARLIHPDLDIDELELRDVGHLSLPIDPRSVHWVATALARSGDARDRNRPGRHLRDRHPVTERARSSPAS